MHAKYGKLPWAELFQPAIALARDGFPVSPRLAKLLADIGPASFTPGSARLFLRCPGTALAGRLQAQKSGACRHAGAHRPRRAPTPFYEGDIAADIAKAVQNDPRKPGTLTAQDLANYRAKEREPVCAPYRAYRVCGARPPSSGAVAVGEVLGLIAPFDLGATPFDCAASPCHRRGGTPRLRRSRPLSGRSRFRRGSGRRPARPGLSRRTPRADRSEPRAKRGHRRVAAQRAARRVRQRRHQGEEAAPAKSPSSTTTATPSP